MRGTQLNKGAQKARASSSRSPVLGTSASWVAVAMCRWLAIWAMDTWASNPLDDDLTRDLS